MSRIAPPARLGDRRMWRRVVARCHPDAGGDHELFIFVQAAQEQLVHGDRDPGRARDHRDRSRPRSNQGEHYCPDRIWFDSTVDFRERTLSILRWAAKENEPYKSVLLLLVDCEAVDHGRAYEHQYMGASYKQLAKVAHLVGFSFEQRREWYLLAESVGISSRHAAHMIGRLSAERRAA